MVRGRSLHQEYAFPATLLIDLAVGVGSLIQVPAVSENPVGGN